MPQEITIPDTKPDADDIQVGDDGTGCANDPDPLGNTTLIEARSDSHSRNHM